MQDPRGTRRFGQSLVLVVFGGALIAASAADGPTGSDPDPQRFATASASAHLDGATAPAIDSPANTRLIATAPSDGATPAATALAPDPRDASTEAALRALSRFVTNASHEDALRTAFSAYYAYRAAHPERVRKPYLFFVDFGLDNRTRRGWVFDMDRLALVEGPFTVAHGAGSSRSRNAVPTSFSNRPGSKASSLGLYLAQETYTFRGRAGGRSYSSIGLRMKGESAGFNDAARRRGIVSHGAPYVTARDAGRSEGCPAMELDRARRLLPMLANGGVVFIYSPNDSRWLASDSWVAAQ